MRVFGVDEKRLSLNACSRDDAAWQFVACDADGEPAGAVRLFVVDTATQVLTATLLAGFALVEFADDTIRAAQLGALDRWIQAQGAIPTFVYAGGYFTAQPWRGSGLAAALGMPAVATARLQGCRPSIPFAVTERQAASMISLMGARPLEAEPGRPLAPFWVSSYDCEARIVSFDSMYPHPSIESVTASCSGCG